MCDSEDTLAGVETMADDTDVQRLHDRIDAALEKLEKSSNAVADKLTDLHTDVIVIREAGKRRDSACIGHVKRTNELDITLRGNGKQGILVRLNAVEQKSLGREKFAYLIIGALTAGLFSLGIVLVSKLTG